ncbi:MAG: tetratricopeptide repeat protein [Planctomycetota bacterium]
MSSSAHSSERERSQRLQQVLAECIRRRSSGERLSDDEVLASHADLLPELAAELRKLHLIDEARQRADRTQPLPGTAPDTPGSDVGALADAIRCAETDPPPEIAGYRFVREIHHGGQGVVYEAIQCSTRRRVALKMLHGGPFADLRARTRLEREVRILGHLRHPHIVGVLDSGVAAGCPYYVMDYIAGETLAAYLARRRLSGSERLRLCAEICEAVHAAHLRGVIHRDLKPTNIRIDAEGAPHVLDFGLAKVALEELTDEEQPQVLSLTGQFIGSLPWAAPEQAAGRPDAIDMRTDVYALGVILYQVLTGRMPYDVAGSTHAVLERILTAEPARPSALCRELDDELDTIVLKCLAKERERRYANAGEVARDLRHYLANEPIEARRDSLAYVLRKHLRRHRAAVGVMAAFALVLAVGLVMVLALWRQAVEQRATAQRRATQAELVTGFLERVLSSADPDIVQADQGSLLYRSLRATADNAARQAAGLADQPEVEARVRHTVGRVYLSLGAYPEAAQQLRQATELRTAQLGSDAPATIDSLLLLGWALKEQGHYEPARQVYERATAVRLGLFGGESLPVAEAYNYLGQLYLDQNDLARAEPYLRTALDLQQRHGGEREDIANGLASLGSLLRRADRLDEAEPPLREALQIRRALYGEEHHYTLVSMNKLALLLRARGATTEARALLQRYVELGPQVLGPGHPHLGAALVNLGSTFSDEGDEAVAEGWYRRGIDVLQRARGADHPQVGEALVHLGSSLRKQGRAAEATDCCERALVLLRPGDVRRVPALLLRGQLLAGAGDVTGAAAAYQEGVALSTEKLGPDHRETLRLRQALTDLPASRP